jgi:hypothetical protein
VYENNPEIFTGSEAGAVEELSRGAFDVIMITSFGDSLEAEECTSDCVSVVLRKPASLAELRKSFARLGFDQPTDLSRPGWPGLTLTGSGATIRRKTADIAASSLQKGQVS